jgi:hypothetical protein
VFQIGRCGPGVDYRFTNLLRLSLCMIEPSRCVLLLRDQTSMTTPAPLLMAITNPPPTKRPLAAPPQVYRLSE